MPASREKPLTAVLPLPVLEQAQRDLVSLRVAQCDAGLKKFKDARAPLEALAAGERLKTSGARKSKAKKVEGEKSGDTRALEKRIEEALGLKASLVMTGKGEHTVLTLEIADYEQLDTVVERLTRR